jgi:HK97 family phage prohead protease
MSFVRSYPLEDIQIRSGGDGRTVEAYAAVFDTPAEISDQQGRYREQIARTAFTRTIQHRATSFGVFYNHGLTLHGTASDRGSVPLGRPLEPPRADQRGLVTVTRYNRTELADQVLEAIRNGDITGQSFSGKFVDSSPAMPRGGYRPDRNGDLPLVTRNEIAMREYGPTPSPAYDVPMMLGVRSSVRAALGADFGRIADAVSSRSLTPEDTATLSALLARLAADAAALDPVMLALGAADCGLGDAQTTLSALLGVPDPDVEDEPMDGDPTSAGGPGPGRSGTGLTGPLAAEDPHAVHSGRLAARVRAGLIARGLAS